MINAVHNPAPAATTTAHRCRLIWLHEWAMHWDHITLLMFKGALSWVHPIPTLQLSRDAGRKRQMFWVGSAFLPANSMAKLTKGHATAAGTKGQPVAMHLVTMAADLPCCLADGFHPTGNVCSHTLTCSSPCLLQPPSFLVHAVYLHSVHLIFSHGGGPHGVRLHRTGWPGHGCSMHMCSLKSLGRQR